MSNDDNIYRFIAMKAAGKKAYELCKKEYTKKIPLIPKEQQYVMETVSDIINLSLQHREVDIPTDSMLNTYISAELGIKWFLDTGNRTVTTRILKTKCPNPACPGTTKCSAGLLHGIFDLIAECGGIAPKGCIWITVLYNPLDELVKAVVTSVVYLYHLKTKKTIPLMRNHPKKCRYFYCDKPGKFKCSMCRDKTIRYCGAKHQEIDWIIHKDICTKKHKNKKK